MDDLLAAARDAKAVIVKAEMVLEEVGGHTAWMGDDAVATFVAGYYRWKADEGYRDIVKQLEAAIRDAKEN